MASKPANEAADGDNAQPKSKKKMIIIILAAVVVIAVAAAAGMLFILKKNTTEEGTEQASHKEEKPRTPPQFLPLENLVVNLSSENGARFMQLGVTLQVEDHKASDAVKAYMPAVRDGVLRLASQRTAEDLLKPQGKESLAQDILELVRDITGAKNEKGQSSVQAVLFSSFIVQ